MFNWSKPFKPTRYTLCPYLLGTEFVTLITKRIGSEITQIIFLNSISEIKKALFKSEHHQLHLIFGLPFLLLSFKTRFYSEFIYSQCGGGGYSALSPHPVDPPLFSRSDICYQFSRWRRVIDVAVFLIRLGLYFGI